MSPEIRKLAQQIVDFKATLEMQGRIDYLASRANEGELSVQERDEYECIVEAIDQIALLQTHARKLLAIKPTGE